MYYAHKFCRSIKPTKYKYYKRLYENWLLAKLGYTILIVLNIFTIRKMQTISVNDKVMKDS